MKLVMPESCQPSNTCRAKPAFHRALARATPASITGTFRCSRISGCQGALQFKLQFRTEGYNAFNHTQFSGVDTAARFDQQGGQTSGTFGTFTGARNPRLVQLALRLLF